MRKLLLAAAAVCSLFTAPASAEVLTYATVGHWTVSFARADAGESFKPFCAMDTMLIRENGTQGFLSFTSYTDGSAWIYVQSDDWEIVPNRKYGSAVITIGRQNWQAPATGATVEDRDALNMYLNQRTDFWQALYYGGRINIRFPNDSISVSLDGSAAALGKMSECWNIIHPGKRNPFGEDASDTGKTNPFGTI